MRVITLYFLLIITMPLSFANEVEYLNESVNQQAPYKIEGHLYLGGNIGWGNFQDACQQPKNNCTDDALSYGGYVGYQFNPYFSLEVGINSYSDLKANYLNDKSSVDIWDGNLVTVFSLPLSNRTSLYSKLGGTYISIEKEINGVGYASARVDCVRCQLSSIARLGVARRVQIY